MYKKIIEYKKIFVELEAIFLFNIRRYKKIEYKKAVTPLEIALHYDPLSRNHAKCSRRFVKMHCYIRHGLRHSSSVSYFFTKQKDISNQRSRGICQHPVFKFLCV